jgi:hypothetical protein
MGFYDDMTAATEQYGPDFVRLEITDIILEGSALNEDEEMSFDVAVTNTGPLRLADLQVRITGLNGAQVKDAGAAAPWVDEFVSAVGQFPLIDAHNGADPQTNAGKFRMKAPSRPQAARDLVRVTLEEWRGDFEHLLVSHSLGSTAVEATYRDRVRAA